MRARLAATITMLVSVYAIGCSDEAPPAGQAPPVGETADAVAEVTPSEREQLEVLGYVNAVPVPEEDVGVSGVVLHDAERAFNGLNLFNNRNETIAKLMDMEGRVLHRWSSDEQGEARVAFEQRLPGPMPRHMEGWNHVELMGDGGLLVIASHHLLLRLDRDSKLEWKIDAPVHHDVSVAPDGEIHVLAAAIRVAEIDGEPVAFQDNVVLVVSPAGRVLGSHSLFDAMAAPRWKPLLDLSLRRVARVSRERLSHYGAEAASGGAEERELARLYVEAVAGDVGADAGIKNVLFQNQAEDIFHTNSIQVLPFDEPGLWRAGDLLISILRMDMIAVLDQESGELLWSWGRGRLEEAHHATQLEGGDLLVFDNGARRGYSRILRITPASGKVVWTYQADPPEDFYSFRRGGAQALPNGNILITNTDSGQAFEVTEDGDLVWSFLSDHLRAITPDDAGRKRAAIYRMERVTRDSVSSWLDQAERRSEAP